MAADRPAFAAAVGFWLDAAECLQCQPTFDAPDFLMRWRRSDTFADARSAILKLSCHHVVYVQRTFLSLSACGMLPQATFHFSSGFASNFNTNVAWDIHGTQSL